MQKVVYQINSELNKVTGIQRVIMDIHEAIKDSYCSKIVGTVPYNSVDDNLGIKEEDYSKHSKFSNYRNSIVIVHERFYLPIFWALNKFLNYNVKLIYVHHNKLYGNKFLSRFPSRVVAISDEGIKNLTDYFHVPQRNIVKIHNCVREPANINFYKKTFNPDSIKILYPARINSVKQQVEIVSKLKGNIDKRIKLYFAGTGPDYEKLIEVCKDSDQFIPLGFRNDVLSLLKDLDFLMLFSKHEGLPISLIEAAMTSTPIICNSVGGNTEVAENLKNAFVVDSFEDLINTLNKLPELSNSEYVTLSRGSREKYEKSFNFTIFKNAYLKLLES